MCRLIGMLCLWSPIVPVLMGSTGGTPRWLLEAVRPQVHLGRVDGQHGQDHTDSVDEEALDSMDDEEAQDNLTLGCRPHYQHDQEQKGVVH
jgi:hypothetical protein